MRVAVAVLSTVLGGSIAVVTSVAAVSMMGMVTLAAAAGGAVVWVVVKVKGK